MRTIFAAALLLACAACQDTQPTLEPLDPDTNASATYNAIDDVRPCRDGVTQGHPCD